jgi:subtilisin family serine protease
MIRRRRIPSAFTVFLVLALLASMGLPGQAAGQPSAQDAARKIAPHLRKAFQKDPLQQFVVEFRQKADLRGAGAIKGFTQRGRFVLRSLRTTATRSQAGAQRLVARTKGATATSFWITNVLVVRGNASLAEALAKLPDVRRIRSPKVYRIIKPVGASPVRLAPVGDPEWGVAKIGADLVWEQGITGQGVVVANLDTGVDYLHSALVNQYRGNDGDSFTHDYNWWDPTGICGDSPCDNAAHGTHTMGTIVGGDGPGPFAPDIGVAPGARWIAAKGCEDFGCSEFALLSGGEFLLAPTDLQGENPDPSKRPDIISNSWGSDDPDDTFFLGIVQAWRAAGIVPLFANGNAGEFGCGSAGTPGNFQEVLGIGATDINDDIAFFSSLGPAPDGRVKPDVSAPGVDVVSSVPGEGYEAFSGTSMATPHTAGTVALMLSAEPGLIGQFDAVSAAVTGTAVDRFDDSCGGDEDGDPNNVYGHGRIDALAAVDLVKNGGTLTGRVKDAASDDPIGGARITADNGDRQFGAVTDDSGRYELFLAADTYVVTADAFGYEQGFAEDVEVVTDEVTNQNFDLSPVPRFKVRGVVRAAENGSPMKRVKVVALGAPAPPVFTNALGRYSLTLPAGAYTLQAAAGGCTETGLADVELFDGNVTQNFRLFRKLDDFGHGCRPIGFSWVNAKFNTGLFGDEFSGRLRIPFAFPFYGSAYRQVFISDNGYVNFLEADQYNSFPTEIPSHSLPNAAIYGLWQDLIVDEGGHIDYQTVGSRPNRAFVIEFFRVRAVASADPVTFEMKLWENGRIDLLYGNNSANPGDGRDALVGIENDEGTDALQFSYLEQLLGANEAFRFERVATGVVRGFVRDANDGTPIEGATVAAEPGGRMTRTDGDGAYALRLRPGSYKLVVSSDPYRRASRQIQIAARRNLTANFRLKASAARVSPSEVRAGVDFGETAGATLTISNTGSHVLRWTAKERNVGAEPPDLPPLNQRVQRKPVWAPGVREKLPRARIPNPLQADFLDTIIEDPAGDAEGPVDITTVRAGSDGSTVATMAIDFTSGTPMDEAVGFVMFDTDQDPSTGIPPTEFLGKPSQDIGVDYFADLFGIHDFEPAVYIVDTINFEVVAVVPVTIEEQTVTFDIPLEAVGGDDGSIDTAMVLGDFFQPTDWAPDEGHGTIQPFSDVPWMSETPESGGVRAGRSQDVALLLGGPNLAPGEYHALVLFVTNAPKQPLLSVDVTLTVAMPEEFGAIEGTVTDEHTEDPIGGVTVALQSEWQGEPRTITAETGSDGTYELFGPEGTWPLTFTKDGYVTFERSVDITRGERSSGVDAAMHLAQPHASVEGGPFTFILTPGRQDTGTITLSNAEGHADLTFSTGEVELGGGAAGTPAGKDSARKLPRGFDHKARSARGLPPTPRAQGVPNAPGDVITSWPTGMTLPWGVNFNGDVWLSDPEELIDVRFTPEGDRLGDFGTPWAGAWAADMAWDPGRGLIWQVNVGGDNGIYGLDPADGSVEEVITGSPWDNISQRGLAYDPATDAFYIGGWNEGILYRVAGPSWANPGEVLGECSPPDPNISGLAWNPSFALVWAATNSETDTIWLLDPATCEALQSLPHPDPDFNGAGLEMDGVGNLWTVSQLGGRAYLIDSGVPNFSDVPWLSLAPTEGTVPAGDSTEVTVAVDSTGLEPGIYRAAAVITTNDRDHANFQVPVVLIVPAYQQGVNAGGGDYTDSNGDAYAADQAYSPGSFGYEGLGSLPFSTSDPIEGTEDDPLYQDQRIGMAAYRLDVADGHYRVDLRFAELQSNSSGERVFHVTIEDAPVLFNFDVFDTAGGQDIAVDRLFETDVADGRLDIEFFGRFGQPIINAILVTELPPGGEGMRVR